MAKKKKSDGYDIGEVIDVDLHSVTRNKFLNYAVSVITSRALPDVRDGLKPVQRRILYAMYRDLKLTPEKKTLKCAKIVGQVLGNYHPHGDSAVYETLVRMAQPWSLRYPLIEGQGNFGSIDGDGAAAYRYTEAKLQKVAVPFLEEITKDTVDFRSNFDDSAEEPTVLPSRIPQLLVNGCTGIAVGVATNIPPHNLNEVVDAATYLIDDPEADTAKLLTKIKGPDFPTGGQLLEDRQTLIEIYETGQGRIRCRGEYEIEEGKYSENSIVVTSIPYQVNKSTLVESIGQIIMDKKVPHLLDVRDESTEIMRIVLTVKKDADPETIMAYLYKHTQLRSSFHVNMTCLVPDRSPAGVRPDRLSLKEALVHFNEFRFEVTERRLKHELRLLKERIHILRGFQIVFDDLDKALNIIRNSDGRADAAQKLMEAFPLDQKQTDAILDLRLYRLGRPDVKSVMDELKEKMAQKEELEMLLDSKSRLWGVVKDEMQEMARTHGDARRTKVLVKGAEEYSYDEQSLILDEDATVLVSRDGWVRRVGTITDLSKARLRAGDELQYAVRGSTLAPIVFFTNYGICYTCLVNDIVQTTGYGEPIHGTFAFKDGEKIIACFVLDGRVLQGAITAEGEEEPELQGVALTSDGKGFRFSLQGYMDTSTKNGRKFARPSGGAQVIGVKLCRPALQLLATGTRFGRGALCKLEEVNFLSGAGKGVTVIKLDRDDRVVGFEPLAEDAPTDAGLRLIRDEGGREIVVHPKDVKLTGRAGKGQRLLKRGLLNPVVDPVALVGPPVPSESSLGETEPEPVAEAPSPDDVRGDEPSIEQLGLGLSDEYDINDTRETE